MNRSSVCYLGMNHSYVCYLGTNHSPACSLGVNHSSVYSVGVNHSSVCSLGVNCVTVLAVMQGSGCSAGCVQRLGLWLLCLSACRLLGIATGNFLSAVVTHTHTHLSLIHI